MTEEYLITAEKKAELENELTERTTKLRPEIGERVQYARSLGDLKENSEYHIAREEQGKNESRIQEIKAILKYAKIITKEEGGHAQLTSVVVLQKKGSDTTREFTLVSPTEADMAEGKLSIESPIGAAVLGRHQGDTVLVQTPNGEVEWNIISIN